MNDSILDVRLMPTPSDRTVDREYAGVLLSDSDGNYLLQRRDKNAGIANPGMITLFGGIVEPGESHRESAIRELREELELEFAVDDLELAGYVDKAERDGTLTRCAIFIAPPVSPSHLVLHEGAAIESRKVIDYLSSADLSKVARLALEFAMDRVSPRGRTTPD
jgi:ADP-ribose pyrophosphatase YjhB (NUDIX family)